MSAAKSWHGRGAVLAGLCLCLAVAGWGQAVAPALPLLLGNEPLPLLAAPVALTPPPTTYLRDVFYATDAAPGIASFAAHADDVTLIAPQSYSLDRYGNLRGSLPANLMAIARAHRIPVMPLVVNDGFSRWQAHAMLRDVMARDRAVGALIETARDEQLAGFQIDFEGLYWTDRDAFSRFIEEAADALHRHGKILSVAVGARISETRTDNFRTYSGVYDYGRLAAAADFLSVMAYPEHNGDDPGPLASTPWVEQVIQHELQYIPPDKFSLGVPTYETDWTERRVRVSIWRRIGRRLRHFFHWTYHLLGRDHPATDAGGDLEWDPTLQSSYRVYGTGRHRHVIWVEDARSFAAKLALVRRYHLRGFSVWRLGLEDPGIWAQLPAPAGAPESQLAEARPPAPPPAAPVLLAEPSPLAIHAFVAERLNGPRLEPVRRRLARRYVRQRRSTSHRATAARRAGAAATHRTASRRQTGHASSGGSKPKPPAKPAASATAGDDGHR